MARTTKRTKIKLNGCLNSPHPVEIVAQPELWACLAGGGGGPWIRALVKDYKARQSLLSIGRRCDCTTSALQAPIWLNTNLRSQCSPKTNAIFPAHFLSYTHTHTHTHTVRGNPCLCLTPISFNTLIPYFNTLILPYFNTLIPCFNTLILPYFKTQQGAENPLLPISCYLLPIGSSLLTGSHGC